MADSNNSLRQVAAYVADMQRRGIYGTDGSPRERTAKLWQCLRLAGANLRRDHHGIYPWHASVHHMHYALESKHYKARAWSFGVYDDATFYEYATTGRLGALDGALFVKHATVTQERLVQEHGTYVMPFDRFEPVSMPPSGTWVALIYDVDEADREPEIVWNHYELTATELRTVMMTKSHMARVPVEFMKAHHVHHMQDVGFQMPRLLLDVSEPRTGEVQLRGLSVELRTEQHRWSKWTRSPIGDTIDSVMPIADDPANESRGPIVDAIQEAAKKRRAEGLAGYYSTRSAQTQVGRPGDVKAVADATLAMVAMHMAVEKTVVDHLDKVAAKLTEMDPRWNPASLETADAVLRATLGVEAVFAVLSPSGRDSPVLCELKRIFGDKGVPSLRKMLRGESGLPHSVPSMDNAQEFLDAVLATKVDMDVDRRELVTEKYMARVLSKVEHPCWTAGRSPLLLSVLVSAMPDNFVQRVQAVLSDQLNMRNAVLKHSGSRQPPHVDWKGVVAPGVYVIAPLEDYDRAAHAIAGSRMDVFEPVLLDDYPRFFEMLTALEKDASTEFEARQLRFRAQSSVGTVWFVQTDAIAKDDQSAKLKFDADKMRAILCLKGTTQDGSTLCMVMDQATGHSLTALSHVAADYRPALLTDVISAMVNSTATAADTGNAVVAAARTAANQTKAANSYAAVTPVSSDKQAPGELRVPMLLQMLQQMRGVTMMPVRAALDNKPIRVASAVDQTVLVHYIDPINSHLSAQGFPVNTKDDVIGTRSVHITPSVVNVKAGGRDHAINTLSIGPQIYVQSDAVETLHALQNSAQDALSTRLSKPVLHDPYDDHSSTLFNPRVINASGMREKLAERDDPRLPNNVGTLGSRSYIHSVDERNDPSVYYGHTADEWLSPFA